MIAVLVNALFYSNKFIMSSVAKSAYRGDLQGALRALQNGDDINRPVWSMWSSRVPGWTPLMLASSRRDVRMLELLMSQGADPNRIDDHGRSAAYILFHGPSSREVDDCLRILMKAGASSNAVPASGVPLLMEAILDGDVESVQVLLQYGADINEPDREGFSPLYYALFVKYDPNISILLLQRGADVSAATPLGMPIWKLADTAPIDARVKKEVERARTAN